MLVFFKELKKIENRKWKIVFETEFYKA